MNQHEAGIAGSGRTDVSLNESHGLRGPVWTLRPHVWKNRAKSIVTNLAETEKMKNDKPPLGRCFPILYLGFGFMNPRRRARFLNLRDSMQTLRPLFLMSF